MARSTPTTPQVNPARRATATVLRDLAALMEEEGARISGVIDTLAIRHPRVDPALLHRLAVMAQALFLAIDKEMD